MPALSAASILAALPTEVGPAVVLRGDHRLVGAAPLLASASVSLNTSGLYVGQAIGSAIGGALFAREMYYVIGYVGIGFVALAVGAVFLSRRMR